MVWTRLRWRLRGAWQWPAFGAALIAETVLLDALPVWGDGPGGPVPAALLAGSLNLIIVAVAAPLAGRLVRRRRPDLPRAIATDYAGTALIGVLLCALIGGGLAHKPERDRARVAYVAQLAAFAHYVAAQEPSYRARLAEIDTIALDRDEFRTCVPDAARRRWLCAFVNTDQSPPGITRDRETLPNSEYRR